MGEHITYYFNLMSKLNDVLTYINSTNFKENNKIHSHITECKKICIHNIKSEPLVNLFLDEVVTNNNNNTIHDIINKESTTTTSEQDFANLARLFMEDKPTQVKNIEIKNELNTSHSNINCQIKKKI